MRVSVGVALVCCLACGKVEPPGDDDDGTTADDADPEDDDGDNDAGDGSPDGAPADAMTIISPACSEPAVCGDAGEVATVADIAAIATQCETWGAHDVDRFRPRTPTFLVTQPLSFCPGDFSLPRDCQTGTSCNAGKRVSVDPHLQGIVRMMACENGDEGALLSAGARFRLRFDLDPPSLISPNYTAHIRFERPCDVECEEEERLCEEAKQCYDDPEFCFSCGVGTREYCACHTPDNGVIFDCTECEYTLGDAVFIGQCEIGICETDPSFCPESAGPAATCETEAALCPQNAGPP